MNKWQRGQKAEIAKRAGVTRAYVGNLLAKRVNASPLNARKLEQASREIGVFIPRYDWMEATITKNILFG